MKDKRLLISLMVTGFMSTLFYSNMMNHFSEINIWIELLIMLFSTCIGLIFGYNFYRNK